MEVQQLKTIKSAVEPRSTNARLSTAASVFHPGGQSILIQSYFNHSTMATATKARPKLLK